MRGISENKAVRTAEVSHLSQHRIYVGATCPSCGTDIPVGPYGWAQYASLFGQPVNSPPIREPAPAHVAAQQAYVMADRERTQAYGEVVRLEDELSRANMPTTEFTVLHGMRTNEPDPVKVAQLTEKLSAAREARDAADARTSNALRTANRIKA